MVDAAAAGRFLSGPGPAIAPEVRSRWWPRRARHCPSVDALNPGTDRSASLHEKPDFVLAAGRTDGHAKNFSIQILPQGQFKLAPLYDVMSIWPIEGPGPNQWSIHKLKLAMAFWGKNKHYQHKEVLQRHLVSTAKICGLKADVASMIEEIVTQTPQAIAHPSPTATRVQGSRTRQNPGGLASHVEQAQLKARHCGSCAPLAPKQPYFFLAGASCTPLALANVRITSRMILR
ncbi:hypothetical protein GHT06_007194 [Daphnia sinensis]|uniref:HipA-like C-terminal domain-containing protein n=1 Tax=Daphnia sinensis TaxID=1820382 RepID=A0AAD5KDM6_9CRUS|nr:hypothetical protein GHT06_006649 [Daphnia sinensis]KAI9549320.1 hypothetical protein GHT06_006619 [Daphnia sinensis]KAI9549394.1 hypothetical protein GHT06_007194 [Daphnia sinensis]